MSTEVKKAPTPDEWEYLEGVLDQGLVLGAWPNTRRAEGSFIHRIDLHNTSRRLVYLLKKQFISGRVGERNRQEHNPPARKTHFIWTIANAGAGLEFLDLTQGHLYFKQGLAEKYAHFLRSLLNNEVDVNDRLEEFRRAKEAPPSTKEYLPPPRNLAGRLDANSFIGILTRSKDAPLSSAYAQVRLGTAFPGLARRLKQEFGGRFAPHRSAFLWTVNGNQAAKVLRTILPHLRNMKDRATLVLEFEDIKRVLSRKGRGSRQSNLSIEALQRTYPDFNRKDLLKSYIEHVRNLNANPV